MSFGSMIVGKVKDLERKKQGHSPEAIASLALKDLLIKATPEQLNTAASNLFQFRNSATNPPPIWGNGTREIVEALEKYLKTLQTIKQSKR